MRALGIVLLALGAAVVVALVTQFRTIQSMQTEIGALRAAREADRREAKASYATVIERIKPAEADAIGLQEVAKLRDEVAALRVEVKQVGAAHTELAAAMAEAAPVQLVPSTDWTNAGRESPAATMETIYWAALNGELNVLATALLIPDDDRPKVDTWFASLAESTREQYGTAEKLIGLLVAKDAGPLTGMQILDSENLSDADVITRVRFETDDGSVDYAEYILRQTADGWRLVVPADGVDWFARHLQPGN